MDDAPRILSFNTATLGGSVCLVSGEQVLATTFGDPTVSHSSTLLTDIARTLAAAGVSLEEVDLLAAAAGPGSFTGLRIGVASLKALSLTLRRPCFGIPTLHALAHSGGPSPATVALVPAGRGEVFAQLFSVTEIGSVQARDEPAHLPPRAMLEKYEAFTSLTWVGEGADVHRESIQAHATSKKIEFSLGTRSHAGWALLGREENLARDIAALAWQRHKTGQVETADSLQAIYVRPSDAELKKNVGE